MRFPPRLWYHRLRAFFWAWYFGWPGQKIKVVGVTGTDGKTTTTEITAHLFHEMGFKVASATTVAYRFNQIIEKPPSKKTSQDCQEINHFLKKALQEKCEIAILEVSSVALDQGRFNGVNFVACGLTNITPEELRYHGSFEKYRSAKRLLFEKCHGTHVLPAIPEFTNWAKLPSQRKIIWGLNKIHNFPNSEILLAEKAKLQKTGSRFTIRNQDFTLNLSADFNIENALCAIGLVLSQNINKSSKKSSIPFSLQTHSTPLNPPVYPTFFNPPVYWWEKCAQALATFTTVPGRMQQIKNKQGLNIFIDYAMTPNGYRRLLQTTRNSFPKSKIIIVFGCAGGGRDRDKRPEIGKITSELADFVILTDDESYDEKTKNIVKDIKSGIKSKSRAKVKIILDRQKAIAHALQIAQKGDVILIPGIGAETSRNVSGREIVWSDKEVVKEELGKI